MLTDCAARRLTRYLILIPVWMLISSGAAEAGLSITSPSGGETWTAGDPVTVTWTATSLSPNLPVWTFIHRVGDRHGACLVSSGATTPFNDAVVGDGEVSFQLPHWLGDADDYVVELWAMGYSQVLDTAQSAPLSITGSGAVQSLVVTSPTASTSWSAGTTQIVTWTATNLQGFLQGSAFDNRESVTYFAPMQAEDQEVTWHIPENLGNSAAYELLFLTYPAAQPAHYTLSPAFTITGSQPRPTISITSPNGGELWTAGQAQDVCWTSSESSGDVGVTLTKGGGPTGTFGRLVDVAVGCHSTTPCESFDGDDFRAAVTLATTTGVRVHDQSDADFTIVGVSPPITLEITSPGDGVVWSAGSTQTITWNATNATGKQVVLSLYKSSGELVTQLGEETADAGAFTWEICPYMEDGGDYVIEGHINQPGCPTVFATSPGTFTIGDGLSPPTFELSSPNGGEWWQLDEMQTITWTTEATYGYFGVEVFQNGEKVGVAGWPDLVDGQCYWWPYSWQYDPGAGYTIRLTWYGSGCPRFDTQDESDAWFGLTESACRCGDLTGDGLVDLSDFATFAFCFRQSAPVPGCDADELTCCDLNGDGSVDLIDFATFALLFWQPPAGEPPYCLDLDRDGYSGPLGSSEDCNDGNALVNPGAPEDCSNSIDDDCDGLTDGQDEDCAAPPCVCGHGALQSGTTRRCSERPVRLAISSVDRPARGRPGSPRKRLP